MARKNVLCKYETMMVRGRGGGEESESISDVGFPYEVSYNGCHSTGSKGKIIERRAASTEPVRFVRSSQQYANETEIFPLPFSTSNIMYTRFLMY